MMGAPPGAVHIPFAEAWHVGTDEDIVLLMLAFLPPEGYTWRITPDQARAIATALMHAAYRAEATGGLPT